MEQHPWRIPVVGTGLYALVDEADYPALMDYVWLAHPGGYSQGYADNRLVLMHRWLMKPPPELDVDHINGSKLDNRRANLRVCTRSQNLMNKGRRRDSTSPYKGVTLMPSGRWRAVVGCDGFRHHIGTFDTPEEAARAYDLKAGEVFGEFARLNFAPVSHQATADWRADAS